MSYRDANEVSVSETATKVCTSKRGNCFYKHPSRAAVHGYEGHTCRFDGFKCRFGVGSDETGRRLFH